MEQVVREDSENPINDRARRINVLAGTATLLAFAMPWLVFDLKGGGPGHPSFYAGQLLLPVLFASILVFALPKNPRVHRAWARLIIGVGATAWALYLSLSAWNEQQGEVKRKAAFVQAMQTAAGPSIASFQEAEQRVANLDLYAAFRPEVLVDAKARAQAASQLSDYRLYSLLRFSAYRDIGAAQEQAIAGAELTAAERADALEQFHQARAEVEAALKKLDDAQIKIYRAAMERLQKIRDGALIAGPDGDAVWRHNGQKAGLGLNVELDGYDLSVAQKEWQALAAKGRAQLAKAGVPTPHSGPTEQESVGKH